MEWIDIIILGVIVVFAVSGYFKGIIKMLFNLLSVFISTGLTYFLYPYVSNFIMKHTQLYHNLSMQISKTFKLELLFKGIDQKEDQFSIIQKLPLPKGTKEMLVANNNPDMFQLLDASSVEDYISRSLASVVISMIAFVTLFIIISIILTILMNVLNLVAKNTTLDGTNKLLGAGLGVLTSLVFVFIGLLFLSIFVSGKNNSDIMMLIDRSIVTKFLYNNNPIMDILNNNVQNNHFWKIISFNK